MPMEFELKKSYAFIIGMVLVIAFIYIAKLLSNMYTSFFIVVVILSIWISLPLIASFLATRYWSLSGVLICILYISIITFILPVVLEWDNFRGRNRGVSLFFIVMISCFILSLITTVLGGAAGYFFRKKTIPNPNEHSS